MKKDDLRKTMLFREMTDEEITSALSHLSASEKSYQKGRSYFTPALSQTKWGWFLTAVSRSKIMISGVIVLFSAISAKDSSLLKLMPI